MIASLTFNLDEEREEFETTMKAQRYASALDSIKEAFRQKVKYAEKQETTWEEARDLIFENIPDDLLG